MMRLRLLMRDRLQPSAAESGERRRAVAVSGERFKNFANRLR